MVHAFFRPSNDPPTWTVYCRTVVGLQGVGTPRFRSITRDGFLTFEAAVVHIMKEVLEAGPERLTGCIVKLDHGRDLNGERHVVKRVNDGRSWWEAPLDPLLT